MVEILILIVCILLIVACFMVVVKSEKRKYTKEEKKVIPQSIQISFRAYADEILEKEGILLEEAKILNWEAVEEVPFEQGVFEYYRIEYNIVTEIPVENAQGIVLNSREIFAKVGIKDALLVLFF